ncbi:MAG: glycosyltransferase family 4 protein, partial [Calditrichaeota bacterium]|nr:glycosyltransferase family 4 protein [Calditrichota bacterium]
ITLTIAGDGDALESARDFAVQRGLEKISFSGYLTGDAKSDAFLNASCYILPTYSEGIPISVLEAMAYGLPVVTRPVGGMKDFLEDGKMGYIVEILDPSAFAEAVEKLIQEPETCRRMGRYNREFALKHFVASRVAERIKRIYHEVDQLER